MNISNAISFLDEQVSDPSQGLPDELFYYISRTTPLINVELLIKDETGRMLLSWRDDEYYGKGWHLPGGIVRFKETLEQRIQKVAETEIGTRVTFETTPLAIDQFIQPGQKNRGHFISFLYCCFLSSAFTPENKGLNIGDKGFLMWHDCTPDNLLVCHRVYRKFLNP
ncbi:MAG: NUDIX domain-containing protein [Desulfuromonadales bacterium]